jgi:multidrug efflux pump
LLKSTKSELAPIEDRGVILTVINGPDGATMDYTRRYTAAIEKMADKYTEFDRIFTVVGNPTVAQGNVFYRAKPWEDRNKTTLEIAREITPAVAGLPGVTAFPITPPSLGQPFRERPLNFVILTSDSYQNLAQVVRSFQEEIAKNPGIVSVDTDLRLNKPEISMEVDRERAADMGVPVDQIARAVETMMGGRQVTRYKREGDQYDVIVQTAPTGRDTPDDIERVFVRGKGDAMIPLSALVKIKEVVVPRELNHFSQRRSASISPCKRWGHRPTSAGRAWGKAGCGVMGRSRTRWFCTPAGGCGVSPAAQGLVWLVAQVSKATCFALCEPC